MSGMSKQANDNNATVGRRALLVENARGNQDHYELQVNLDKRLLKYDRLKFLHAFSFILSLIMKGPVAYPPSHRHVLAKT